jgi:hypothetical protein
MLKPKSNKLKTEVSMADASTVFFERMEPKILLSADALSGLVGSDPFNDDAANTALDLGASVDLLSTSYDAETDDAGSDPVAADDNLYDLDPVLEYIGDNQENDDNTTSLDTLSAILDGSDSGAASRQETIFIDAATPDYQELLSGIDMDDADTDYQIFILQSDRDGVEQITEILGRFDDVDAVHLLGHGNEQGIQLGGSWLGQDSISDYAESLSAWSDTLNAEADILIYGCNLAADDSGRQFINELASITEADVAASDDLTGNKLLGGDWDLEYRTGYVDNAVAFDVQSWNGLLATFIVNHTGNSVDINPGDGVVNDGFGNISLRAAIMEANALAGLDTIEFNIGGGGVQTIQLSPILPDITDAVILDATTQPGFAGTPIIELDGSLAGAGNGLTLAAGSDGSTISGLVINRFDGNGIHIASDNNNIVSNYIGTNVTGDADLGNTGDGIRIEAGASNNTIGGSSLAAGNVISGNNDDGISVAGSGTSSNLIQGNYIGTDASGTAALGNADDGIVIYSDASDITVGGNAAGESNIISANGSDGIQIGSASSAVSNITIQGNLIGTDVTGVSGLANTQAGIDLEDGQNILIGGTAANAGNTIAFNGQRGIEAGSTATDTSILTNSIYANAGLGIDWGVDNVTPNNSGEQNYPVVTTATTNGTGNITINGTLNSTAGNTFRIEFFASAVADGAGYGEGETYLGFTTVTTDGDGDATFSTPLSATVAVGRFITATATVDLGGNTYGNTSEFAQNVSAAIVVSGNYLDNFDTVAYNNSSGSLDWSGSTWLEVNDDGIPLDSGQIYITGNLLVLEDWDGTTKEITRSVDLSGATSAVLIYDYSINGHVTQGGTVTVEVWDGSIWNTVATYDMKTSVGLTSESFDISAYMDASSKIKIDIISAAGSNAKFSIDNIDVSVTSGINNAPTATNLTSTSNYIEGDAAVSITDIVVSDANSGDIITATLTLADTSTGSLSANDGASYTAGTGAWTITDTVANVNLALANLVFNPTTDNDLNTAISVSIDDGDEDASGPLSGTINLTVTAVNDAPVATDDAVTVAEDVPYNSVTSLLANDSDLDGDSLSVVTGTFATSQGGSITFNADGSYSYTQAANFNGTDTVNYSVTDGALTDTGLLTLTVTAANDAPVATDDAVTVAEDVPYNSVTSLLANDSDLDGDSLSVVTGTFATSQGGSITFNADGSYSYTSATNFNGTDSVSYSVTDGALTDTGLLTLTVTAVNDAPTTAPVTLVATGEDSGARLITQAELLANSNDGDGDALTATNLVIASGSGALLDNGDGSWSYTAAADDDSSVSFSYTVSDGILTAAGSADMDITPVSDTPLVNNDAFTVNEGSTTTLNLAANDSDVDGTLDLSSIIITTAPSNGSIVVNADGSVDYTHDGSETLADSFTYTIMDNSGAVSNSGTVNITVTPVNDAPLANNDAFTVTEGSITTLNLAANDSDVDGTLDLTSIVITTAPTNGSIVVNADGTVDYSHDGSEILADSFSYTILDNSGVVSNTGTIKLNVMNASVLAALEVIATDVVLETPDTSNAENTSSAGDDNNPVKATADEVTLNATNEDVFEASTFAASIGTRRLLDLPAFFQADNEPAERNTIIIRDNDTPTARKVDITAIDHLRAQLTDFSGPLQVVSSDSFMSKLDDVHEEIVLENRKFDMVVGSSMSMSAGFSVGYVIWLVRSGVLMSGLLSSMPAWSFIDPLPVLASMGKKDNEDDESLESMVEEKEDDRKKEDDKEKEDDK